MQLKYTGPVKELGFKGPKTGQQYMAFGNQPFEVNDDDGAALLKQYGTVLKEVKPARSSRPKPKSQLPTEPVESEEPDGTVND